MILLIGQGAMHLGGQAKMKLRELPLLWLIPGTQPSMGCRRLKKKQPLHLLKEK